VPGVDVVAPALEPDRPLSDGREHPGRIKDLGDRVAEPEPQKTRLGQDDRVQILLAELAQPGFHVATEVDHPQVRPAVQELGSPAQAARSDDGCGRQVFESLVFLGNERIAGRPPRRDGRQFQARHRDRRQVFQAMDRDVDAIGEEGVLNGLGEDAEAAHRGNRPVLDHVAVGLDDDDFHGPRLDDGPKPIGDVVGLPEGEVAATGAEPKGGHRKSQ
jgi:hypothetical protein